MGVACGPRGIRFGVFGAVLSTSQGHISQNQIGDISTLNEELNNREDLLIMEGDTLSMPFRDYRDRAEGIHVKFRMDYFEKAPTSRGMWSDGAVFEAKETHETSPQFSDLKATGCLSRSPTSVRPKRHNCGRQAVGDKPVHIGPRIQLNEQMGNAPEPDTKHWLHLYAHQVGPCVPPKPMKRAGWVAGRTPCKSATACSLGAC